MHDDMGAMHHDTGAMQHASNAMAISATLHCLTGCAIGEIVGMVIGSAAGWSNTPTVAVSFALSFVFGYTLSTLPLLRAGLAVTAALSVVIAADTLSILTMEIVDNVTMVLIPGAMNAGLINVQFWAGMLISLTVAFFAAWPVNRYLLQRGKGHALTHEYHGADVPASRAWIPDFPTGALVATILAFILGGLTVSIADSLESDDSAMGAGAVAARAE